jgi:antitoxin component of MazEF toxin-antitoxin module
MDTVIKKWRDGFFVQIPDAFAEKISLVKKTYAEFSLEGGKILVKPVSRLRYTPGALSDKTEPEDSYPEISQTRTWELCGSLDIEKPDPRYIIAHDEHGRIITNYAEQIDDVLTKDIHV